MRRRWSSTTCRRPRRAASTAARASSGPPSAHPPTTAPVAGLVDSKVRPEVDSSHFPSMNIMRAVSFRSAPGAAAAAPSVQSVGVAARRHGRRRRGDNYVRRSPRPLGAAPAPRGPRGHPPALHRLRGVPRRRRLRQLRPTLRRGGGRGPSRPGRPGQGPAGHPGRDGEVGRRWRELPSGDQPGDHPRRRPGHRQGHVDGGGPGGRWQRHRLHAGLPPRPADPAQRRVEVPAPQGHGAKFPRSTRARPADRPRRGATRGPARGPGP